MRSKVSQPSSMEMRIMRRKKPKFKPTDEQIEVAGEAARSAYRSSQHIGEATRWECAAEAALKTLAANNPTPNQQALDAVVEATTEYLEWLEAEAEGYDGGFVDGLSWAKSGFEKHFAAALNTLKGEGRDER